MAVEENKAVVRRYWDAFNTHNLDLWDDLCTLNFKAHDMPGKDRAAVKQTIQQLLVAFPDMTSSEDDLLSDGDKVVVRRTFRGTHKGEFMGIPASGKEMTNSGIFIHRIADGLIEEQWVVTDALSMLQQIGAVLSPREG